MTARTAFVLGGGGVLGASEVGMVGALLRRNAALPHLSSDPPIECWGVDDDGEIRLALVSLRNQTPIQSKNLRQLAENFGDADDCEIFGVDNGVAPGSPHPVPADTKEFERLFVCRDGAPPVERSGAPQAARQPAECLN